MMMMSSKNFAFTSSLVTCLLPSSWGFNSLPPPHLQQQHCAPHGNACALIDRRYLSLDTEEKEVPSSSSLAADDPGNPTRRNFFASVASSALTTTLLSSSFPVPPARAEGGAKSTADATVTDKIFIEFKGLSAPGDIIDNPDRITIGLFGNDSPQPVSILKQLVTREGYKSKCKPLDTSRTLQKEQLEANKVYNSCLETEHTMGVNYDYSTVWRVMNGERIDVGAVSGKFVARENPTFEDAGSGLTHDAKGVVSVRRGDEAGYSFTIYPGEAPSSALDEDNIVVGRVVGGMDVVNKLNDVPVVKSAGAALAGGKKKNAPSRGCRYGGSELYCNEDKPLKKILLDKTGLL